MASQSDPAFAEWLQQGAGAGFLDAEDMAQLRQKASKRLGKEVEEMRRRLAQLEKDMAAINGVGGSSTSTQNGAHSEPAGKLSVRQLVLRFAHDNPGSLAGEFVQAVQAIRPETDPKYVHSELYKLSKEGGPRILRKEGEKPLSRYFLRKVSTQPLAVARHAESNS